MDVLRECEGGERSRLIEAHLDAADSLGDLQLPPRSRFGDLMGDDPVTTSTWRGYLETRARRNLARSTRELRSIDPVAIAESLPDTTTRAFVFLDAFAGNMLTDGKRITAVLDIGPTSVAGDRRLNSLVAAVYLDSPQITPVATRADVDVAMSWLRAARLDDWLAPTRQWLAAYWSFAIDDAATLAWCRSVLLNAPA
jgi:hypothetical protein